MPAATASQRSRSERGPSGGPPTSASAPSTGSAYAQRKIAAVAGATSARSTRIAENAIVTSAPQPRRRREPRESAARVTRVELTTRGWPTMQAVPTRLKPSRP